MIQLYLTFLHSLMKLLRSILFFPLVTALVLAGCGSKLASDVSGSKTVFKIVEDAWIGYAPLHLAQKKHFFDDVDVQMIVTPDVAQRNLILVRGDAQASAITVDMLVLSNDEKVPAVAVVGMDFSNGADGIVAVNAVKTIEDLRGKTVLVQKNYASEALLNYLLEKAGIPFNQVQTVDTEAGAAGAAFVAGKADVAVTFEPWLSKAKRRPGAHVLLSSRDAPGVIVDVLAVNREYLNAHPDVVAKVVKGWFRAVEYWKAHPAEANAIMAEFYQVTPEEFADQVSGLLWPSLEENVKYFDAASDSSIFDVADTFISIFRKTGQIAVDARPDMTAAVDASVLRSIHASQ